MDGYLISNMVKEYTDPVNDVLLHLIPFAVVCIVVIFGFLLVVKIYNKIFERRARNVKCRDCTLNFLTLEDVKNAKKERRSPNIDNQKKVS